MVKLIQSDFVNLVKILSNIPEFLTARERKLFLITAGFGDNSILNRIDYEGSSRTFCSSLINFLCNYGRIEYDKEALGILLAFIREFIPDNEDNALIIDKIIWGYNMNVASCKVIPISDWKEKYDLSLNKENIIGENTLKPICFLEKAIKASDAVVHIEIKPKGSNSYYGTGFLISPTILITNNHVVPTEEYLNFAIFRFHYKLDINGNEIKPIIYHCKANGIFFTNKELDFTIIEIQDAPGLMFGYLKLCTNKLELYQRVNIIQHPGGQHKMISFQNNYIAYINSKIIQYYTSTLPGSSGSPVLNDVFNVVALHHSGGFLEEPATKRKFLRNEGILITAILQEIKKFSEFIYNELIDKNK